MRGDGDAAARIFDKGKVNFSWGLVTLLAGWPAGTYG